MFTAWKIAGVYILAVIICMLHCVCCVQIFAYTVKYFAFNIEKDGLR